MQDKNEAYSVRKPGMGHIKHYSLIIPKRELQGWLNKSWVEVPDFRGFHYEPGADETVILGKPRTLREIDPNTLIGTTLLRFSASYGTYGMGGPGFMGFTLSNPSRIGISAAENIV